MGCGQQPKPHERRGRYVESSEAVQEFDFSDLLTDDDEQYEQQQRQIIIDVHTLVDEDGDDAIQLHLVAYGLDTADILHVLEIAYIMAEQAGEEDDDDDDL